MQPFVHTVLCLCLTHCLRGTIRAMRESMLAQTYPRGSGLAGMAFTPGLDVFSDMHPGLRTPAKECRCQLAVSNSQLEVERGSKNLTKLLSRHKNQHSDNFTRSTCWLRKGKRPAQRCDFQGFHLRLCHPLLRAGLWSSGWTNSQLDWEEGQKPKSF